MDEPMLCPRRDEVPNVPNLPGGPDRFIGRAGLVSQKRGCSFCGSMPPDDFMDAVRDGVEVGPTDKSYKAYLQLPGAESKFYFQHLSVDQRQEFFELLRDGRLTIGYPGRFNVLPFFIAVAPPKDPT